MLQHAGEIAGTHWEPEQYLKFGGQRLRPALELIERVALSSREGGGLIVDLGCGAGNVTRLLRDRWPGARLVAVDNSPEMLERARAAESEAGEPDALPIEWIDGDAATWTPDEPPNLMYSNAALHWVGAHETLFPRLFDTLAPGGVLAVQMPLSWDLPSHRLLRETLADADGEPLGSDELRAAVGRRWVANAGTYYDLLAPCARTLDIFETEYLQVLEGSDPVLEWVRGTTLRPVLAALTPDERERFLEVYGRRLRETYPQREDGRTLFPFRRLFLVAQA